MPPADVPLPEGLELMPAYVIANVTEARDRDALAEYRRRNTATVASYGGRFLVRGGEQETLEGDWPGVRIVVMEFADADAARAWWDSEEYAPLKELRRGASDTDIVLVEGGDRPRSRRVSSSTSVSTAETTSEPRQPSRPEKKRNIGTGCPSQPAPNHSYGTRYMTTGTFAARSATPSWRAYGCSSPWAAARVGDHELHPPAGALDAVARRRSGRARRFAARAPRARTTSRSGSFATVSRRVARIARRVDAARAAEAFAAAGSAPKTALRSSFSVPSANARKFGSKPNATTRPRPTRSSVAAGRPPRAAAPSAWPETKKSDEPASGIAQRDARAGARREHVARVVEHPRERPDARGERAAVVHPHAEQAARASRRPRRRRRRRPCRRCPAPRRARRRRASRRSGRRR